MKILILTQYFPPEVGAPQNRLHELAVRLKKKGDEVSVLTAMPNYPQMEIMPGYKGKFYCAEEMDGMKIFRAWIYVSKSKSIFKRLLNYFSFVFSSFWIGWLKTGKYDLIICESPPLFLGITAWLLKKLKGAALVFNVSDLWPESAEKLGLVTNKTFLRMATALEEFMYRKSDLISGQTQGICRNIRERFPEKKIYWLPNGVDLSYYDSGSVQSSWRNENGFSPDDMILLYAGIIGHAQGLEVILKAANRLREEKSIHFVLLGTGPERLALLSLKEKLDLPNVHFVDAVPKKEMPAIVAASDAAVIPLKRLDLFKGAIPSKVFENLAMKKPILLGVEGEAKELFIEEGKAGLAYVPEDDADLADKILFFKSNRPALKEMGENGFRYVESKFTRDRIANDFWSFIHENIKR
jgi:glycosyltransferase involved in cell wall biosynthesis